MIVNHTMTHRISRPAVALILVMSAVVLPAGLGRAFDDVIQEKEFYFGGFKSESEKLISGIVHGVGERTYVYPDGEVVTGSNETLLIAFDYSKGLMRVDREIPSRLDNSESRELQVVFHTQFIRMPAYDICVARERNAKLTAAWITEPKRPLAQNVPAYPFDIRTVSFIREEHDWLEPTPLDEYQRKVPTEFTEYVNEGNGTRRFRRIHIEPPGENKLTWRTSIWIDPNRGYSVFKTLDEFIIPETPDAPWRVMTRSQTTWDVIGGVWVPVSHTFAEEHNVNAGQPCLSVKMSFDWKSVNEPLPEKYFSICDFGLDPRTAIMDARKGKGRIGNAVLFGHVGDQCGNVQMCQRNTSTARFAFSLFVPDCSALSFVGFWSGASGWRLA